MKYHSQNTLPEIELFSSTLVGPLGCNHCQSSGNFREVPLCWYKGCAANCRFFGPQCIVREEIIEKDGIKVMNADLVRPTLHFQQSGECSKCAGTGLGDGNGEAFACNDCGGSGQCQHCSSSVVTTVIY